MMIVVHLFLYKMPIVSYSCMMKTEGEDILVAKLPVFRGTIDVCRG